MFGGNMASLKDAAQLLGLDTDKVRNMLYDSPELNIRKGPFGRGANKLSHDAIRKLLEMTGKKYSKKVATVGIEKGGVGKSFLTVNVAVALANAGCRVLLIDLDPQACSTNLLLPQDTDYSNLLTALEIYSSEELGFKDAVVGTNYEGLSLVACKGKARKLHKKLANENPKFILSSKMQGLADYDLILFDVPPTFGDIITSAYITSDLVIMPTLPDIWSIESIDLTMEDIRDAAQEYGCRVPECKVVLNRYSGHRSASKDAIAELEENYSDLLLPFWIKETASIQNSINEGYSIFDSGTTRCPVEIREELKKLADFVCPVGEPAQVADNVTQNNYAETIA